MLINVIVFCTTEICLAHFVYTNSTTAHHALYNGAVVMSTTMSKFVCYRKGLYMQRTFAYVIMIINMIVIILL